MLSTVDKSKPFALSSRFKESLCDTFKSCRRMERKRKTDRSVLTRFRNTNALRSHPISNTPIPINTRTELDVPRRAFRSPPHPAPREKRQEPVQADVGVRRYVFRRLQQPHHRDRQPQPHPERLHRDDAHFFHGVLLGHLLGVFFVGGGFSGDARRFRLLRRHLFCSLGGLFLARERQSGGGFGDAGRLVRPVRPVRRTQRRAGNDQRRCEHIGRRQPDDGATRESV
mmetsp:Transcript_11583/g.42900  ORF Transcript_11583/g.42900 Transcript_11583/m.42900 type:complete len:227 (-) Transcript_11583:26-706(-)